MQLIQHTDQCLLAVRNRGAGIYTNHQYEKIPRQAEALLMTYQEYVIQPQRKTRQKERSYPEATI